MTTHALILISNGSEETEAVTVYDLLVRGGIKVVTAAVTNNGQKQVKCSRGINLVCDHLLEEVMEKKFDALILPGGLVGAENFRDTPAVIDKILTMKQSGKIVAAICATPALVLQHHQLYPQAKMTGYHTTAPLFTPGSYHNARVLHDPTHHLITSQGPGTSLDFGLKIVEQLRGKEVASAVAEELVLPLGVDDYSNY